LRGSLSGQRPTGIIEVGAGHQADRREALAYRLRPMPVLRVRRLHVLMAATVLLFAAGLAVLLLPSSEDRRRDALREAPDRVIGHGPVRLALRLSLVDAGGTARTVAMTSEIDAAAERAHTRLAEVIGPGDLELVALGRILFLSVPEARSEALGARWLRVDAGSLAAARGAGVGPLPDPLTVLHSLEGTTGDVERVRRSGDLTLYRFAIATETLAGLDGSDHEAWAATLLPLGPRMSGEAYLDGDGFPRRMRLVSDLEARGRIVAVLDIDEIRQGITIGVPPDDATREVETVAEALRLVSDP
jgi:hypothetical protein